MIAFEKLMRLGETLGWVDTLFYGLNRCCQAAGGWLGITRYILLAQPVHQQPLLPSNRARAITVRPLQFTDDLGNETTLTRELLATRADRGSICFGAFEGDRLVGCANVAFVTHDDEFLHARFILLPKDRAAWDYDFFVAPRHRLGVVYAKLWEGVFQFLRKRGIEWSLSYVASYNARSLMSHARMGALEIGSFVIVKLGRRQAIIQTSKPFFQIADGSRRRADIPVMAPRNRGISPAAEKRMRREPSLEHHQIPDWVRIERFGIGPVTVDNIVNVNGG